LSEIIPVRIVMPNRPTSVGVGPSVISSGK